MSLTYTLVGSLGKTGSTFERKVLENIAFASLECSVDTAPEYLLRKNADDEVPDTLLPIEVPFGPVTVARLIYISVVNNATIRLTNTDFGVAPEHQEIDLSLGGPEGAIVLFCNSITKITIVDTTTDKSTVLIYIAGI